MRFREADRYGGFAVGLIVMSAGVRVALRHGDATDGHHARRRLDEPDPRSGVRRCPGVRGVEKCYARKTGLRYHVDLHLEVDRQMTVRQSHEIAHEVQQRILERLDWVADVLVHVEPAP